MTSEDVKRSIGKPELLKLQQISQGLKVGRVFGERVLVEPIEPYTKMEEVKRGGLLHIPEEVEKQNKPMPSTGIVIQLGDGMVAGKLRLLKNGMIPKAGQVYSSDDIGEETAPTYKYDLRPGDMVMFDKYHGNDIVIDGRKLKMLDFRDISCTLVATDGSLSDKLEQVTAEAGPDVPVQSGTAIVR